MPPLARSVAKNGRHSPDGLVDDCPRLPVRQVQRTPM
jgi:hypothetical protein